ncbi:transcription factor [Scheffersomyces coipomensis]|uniref:transcription factor n=1 Tax=Scheffersomyces coipomensis TaxID=1788519 RepID=UPI00315D0EC9
MGNVPTKESRSRSSTFSSNSGIQPPSNGDMTGFITRTSVPRRYATSSAMNQSNSNNNLGGLLSNNTSSLLDFKKSKRQEEKDRIQELHYLNLLVKYNENVDGGYLAPFGTYKSNLDFNTDIVRKLIINRELSPFYTPLQDFDESWSENELLIILNQLPLHAIDIAYSDLEENLEDDIDNHKIHKSANYYKRQEQKLKLKNLLIKIKNLQKDEELKFMIEKEKAKSSDNTNVEISSNDLLLALYQNPLECPICFLYYPANLNISRCCLQPICTECFVQIKRLDPHPPHDETSNNQNNADKKFLPHTLISEAASCPYCASPEFGVTYDTPDNIFTGIGSNVKPGDYKIVKDNEFDDEDVDEEEEEDDREEDVLDDEEAVITSSDSASSSPLKSNPEPESITKQSSSIISITKRRRRRSSLAANAPGVITIDMIRPDWEQRLTSARNKLERKAATATAIHASNLLLNGDEDSSRSRSNSNIMMTNSNRNSANSHLVQLQTVEDRMIEEALRLSIIDEEERKKKVEAEEEAKSKK